MTSIYANETPLNHQLLEPFLKEHCISCHGPDKQKADLRLDKMDFSISDKNEALHYQDFLDALNSGEMPPEDEPQPTNTELENTIGELIEGLFKARKALASRGGKVDMRRLNRREYAGSIRHLFGMEPTPTDIPQDRDIENFDTVGARQAFSTEHFDLYYELGRKVLTAGFKWAGVKKKIESHVQEPEFFWNSRFKKDLESYGHITEGKVVRLSKMRREYLQLPHTETGVYLSEPLRHLTYSHSIDPRATYKMSIKAALQGNVHPKRRFISITGYDKPLAVFRVNGTAKESSYSEIEVQPNQLEDRFAGRVGEDRTGAWLSHYLNFLQHTEGIQKDSQGFLWIDHFKFEGPFYPKERSFFDTLLCPKEPTPENKSAIIWDDTNARDLIHAFTFEAFRRSKPTSEYIDKLTSFFINLRNEGKNFNEAMIDTLAIVLASPGFIYHHEKDIVKLGKRKLSQKDIASRLSYFLTGAPPDEELYQASKTSKLSNMKVYHSEIDRLLTSSKRHRFIKGFVSQWADFVRLDSIKVSDKKFPIYTNGLKLSMKQEVLTYMEALIHQNMPVTHLIQSDFAYVNAKMAQHYNIPGVSTNKFIKVTLPNDSPRGGFLAQGAFHVTGSTGMRTSPTVRGMLLLNRFFNSPPPPPPPNVPELGSDINKPMTSREIVNLHQSQAQCSSCHRKMDTVGLALENFDTIGRWRQEEPVGRVMQPITVEGTLKGGALFKNFREFQFSMLSQEKSLARNIVESLIVYSLGRDIEFTDTPHIDTILNKVKRNGYRMKDMIHAVAASPIFFKN